MEDGRIGWEAVALRCGPAAVLCVAEGGRIVEATTRASWALTGASRSVVGEQLAELIHPIDVERFEAWLAELVSAAPGRVVQIDLRTAGERRRFVELQGVSLLEHDAVRAVVVSVAETTRFEERIDELSSRAFQDVLTGLANRALLLERLDQALQLSGGASVIAVDVDGFKHVNDRFGHAVGDRVLAEIGGVLAGAAPPDATVARLGGDEFAVLLPGARGGEADEVAQLLVKAIAGTAMSDEVPMRTISVSAGVASATGRGSAMDLLARADVAMYQAKAAGRGRAARHDPHGTGVGAEMVATLQAENARLARLAGTDELTGIGNLRRYRERLGDVHDRSVRLGFPYALLFCDLDSFKVINKTFGQAVGDQVLQQVVRTISERLRPGDEVHRRGGEELVVILPESSPATAADVAERLRGAVAERSLPRSDEPGDIVTISVGVASFDPGSPRDSAAVEESADQAMRAAKDGGKNRVVVAPE